MGISAGENLFLVVPTWRWDNRAGQPCFMFSGHSQRGLYTKDGQEAFWKEKQKSFPPRGLIPDSETNQGGLQLSQGLELLNRAGLGALSFSSKDKSHRLESC